MSDERGGPASCMRHLYTKNGRPLTVPGSSVYSRQGRVDEAVKWLSEAMKKGFDNLELLKTDPDLENVRQSEFYRGMIKDGH